MAAAPDLYTDTVRALLRRESPSLFLGSIFVAIGFSAAALYRLRARAKDPALLWFGLFSALYGVRLLASADIVRFTVNAPHHALLYLSAAITYTLPFVSILFLREVFPSQRRVLLWVLRGLAAFALAGIVSDQLQGRWYSLTALNSAIVLAAIAFLIATGFRRSNPSTEWRAVRFGLMAFGFFAIIENLEGLGLFPFNFHLEPVGFALFLAALGKVVAKRAIDSQQRLVSIEKELQIAREMQLSILPREMPKSARVSIAARYLPMTAVAGDFYDFLIVDESHLGILVADVSGHGVPAALIASMVKMAVAAQMAHAADPARVISGMNQMLCGKLQGTFVTAAYLFLDLHSGTMRYAAAGHPALLHWNAVAGKVVEITENGLVMGLLPGAKYTSVERPIVKGDRFLLYTDGLLEAANETNEFFGDRRLGALIALADGTGAELCATSVLEGLSRWAGYGTGRLQDDDLTLVVVDITYLG